METRFTPPMSSLWRKSDDNSGRMPMLKSNSRSGRNSVRVTSLTGTCSSSNLNHSHSRQESLVST